MINPCERVFSLFPSQIYLRVKTAAAAANLGEQLREHSIRVGMAQDLSAAGAELPELMTTGRWGSPTMPTKYPEAQAVGRWVVAQYYSGGPGGQRLRSAGTDGRRPEDPGSDHPCSGRRETAPGRHEKDPREVGPGLQSPVRVEGRQKCQVHSGPARRHQDRRGPEGANPGTDREFENAETNRVITKQQSDDLWPLDLIAWGTRETVYAGVEVSITDNAGDGDRAASREETLRKVTRGPVMAVVIASRMNEPCRKLALHL